jgi:hypothetical protein
MRKELAKEHGNEELGLSGDQPWRDVGQGYWEEAEQLRLRVVEIQKENLRADHPSRLTSMNNLASTYRNQA